MSNKKCESVAASEVSRMNREKNKGWFEDKDPLTNKAPIHHEVAVKKEFEKHGFSGATKISPQKENIISVSFNVEKKDLPEFNKATEKFMEENDISVETETKGDKVTVKLPVENLEDYVDFLGDEGFKLDSEEEEQVETILEKDDAKTKKESDKNPNKSDSKDSK
jgi:hypothetical protein